MDVGEKAASSVSGISTIAPMGESAALPIITNSVASGAIGVEGLEETEVTEETEELRSTSLSDVMLHPSSLSIRFLWIE